jgi:L-ribulose-5-phosphate 3-epimerase
MNCSRRSFLKAAACAAGSPIALPSALGSPASFSERPCKKAVKLGMVRGGGTLLEKFTLLKKLGFDGVELDSPNGLDRAEVLDARDASGLVIHGVVDSVHWSKPLSDPDEAVRRAGIDALVTALRDAKAYGASSALLVPAVVNKGVSYRDAYERSVACIREVLPLAAELEIHIALENVWNNFLLSPLELCRYIDEFESPWIGSYFDVGNVVRFAWPEHWIEALGPRILKVDVKEYSRKKQNDEGLWKGFAVELHEGDCDWPTVMKAFDAIGYSGWFTAEIPGGGEERLRDIAARMDRIFAG